MTNGQAGRPGQAPIERDRWMTQRLNVRCRKDNNVPELTIPTRNRPSSALLPESFSFLNGKTLHNHCSCTARSPRQGLGWRCIYSLDDRPFHVSRLPHQIHMQSDRLLDQIQIHSGTVRGPRRRPCSILFIDASLTVFWVQSNLQRLIRSRNGGFRSQVRIKTDR